MTAPAPGVPRQDADAAGESSDSAILTSAARALVLGSALATPKALLGLTDDLTKIGFGTLPPRWGSWEQRHEDIAESDRILAETGLAGEIRDREIGGWTSTDIDGTISRGPARVELWRRVAETSRVPDAIAWLRLLLTDSEPVSAAAAAAALSYWKAPRDRPAPQALSRAQTLLQNFLGSSSPTAQTIAASALRKEAPVLREPPRRPAPVKRGPNSVSTIVHGTFAYPSGWWYRGGDFHTYIQREVRSDLYSDGSGFTWSGAYRKRHREVAAQRFADWAADAVSDSKQLNTVFAHSYGGVVTLLSTRLGVRIAECVLLSTPTPRIDVEWRNIGRAVSLRIHADLVLLAARERQCYRENVDEVYLPGWFIDHADSHNVVIWREQKSASTLGLV